MAVEFKTDHLGYHGGQHDWVLRAVDDGEVVASLWFTEYENTISVKMLESSPEYKKKQKGLGSGIGRVLVRELQKLYPDTQINPGMMTEQGGRLLKALPRKYEPSSAHEQLQTRLSRANAEIERLEKVFEDWGNLPEAEREQSREDVSQQGDRLNRLYDLSRKLERTLEGKPKGKWLVTHRLGFPMKLTLNYRVVRATFQSKPDFSRQPTRNRFSSEYFFQVGPMEYRVSFGEYAADSYLMMFRPAGFKGTPAEQVAFYEQVTGTKVRNPRDIGWMLEEWFDGEDSLKMLGTGQAFKIIGNVVNITNRFIKDIESTRGPVKCLRFMADADEDSRVRVYDKITGSYKSQGFHVSRENDGPYVNFYICRSAPEPPKPVTKKKPAPKKKKQVSQGV